MNYQRFVHAHALLQFARKSNFQFGDSSGQSTLILTAC